MSRDTPSGTGRDSDRGHAQVDLEELLGDLAAFTDESRSAETAEEAREIEQLLAAAHERGLIDSGVRRLEPNDAAEAFVGSVIFASPLLIEDGVFDIATHLFEFTVFGLPIFLIANTAFVVFMTYALLEWTGRNKEETELLVGIVPVRLVMILTVSFLVAALLMTVWGRVGNWHPPAEALARINVIWTVGSLGAGLGDILSDSDASPAVVEAVDDRDDDADTGTDRPGDARLGERRSHGRGSDGPGSGEHLTDGELVATIHEQFENLESTVEHSQDRHELRRIRQRTAQATVDDGFGDRIRKYTSRDIAEAFVGSIFFAIPFLVEDGVFDVAEYFLSFRVGFFPVFFLVNAGFVLLMILALVYWAGPQDVRASRPIFGVVPRRLVGISIVSYLAAAALMTMWGRVGNWQDPVIAMARISVVWTLASFGAALGDILPGESSGEDINDELRNLADLGDDGSDLGGDETDLDDDGTDLTGDDETNLTSDDGTDRER